MTKYNPSRIEKKWQRIWKEGGIYKDYDKDKKFYALDMFPYPSGAGLHVGHPKGYIATDVSARFKMLQGYSVLHPMGWDAFGLPAENFAIKNKIHPQIAVKENIATFKKQLEKFGFTYDWDREINTTDPEYYKWTQWIFLKMFERGLAYESDEPINWCPSCKTGLALEDLEEGKCERCGSVVQQKKMRQWVLKMTEYADRLLDDIDKEKLDWEESIVEQQKNWIGRSEGAIVKFEILISNLNENPKSQIQISNQIPNPNKKSSKLFLEVFTTRLDTIFGCTYCVVGPEHKIIEEIRNKIENIEEVEKYIIKSQNKTDLERTDLQKEKTGVEIEGIKVINPFNGEELPLFVADYVLGHYGTGAVMAVPAHDERDFEFAKKYNLPVKKVILPEELLNIPRNLEDIAAGAKVELRVESDCFTCDGELVNSGKYSGMASEKAREKMTEWLEKNKAGEKKVNFKMRDWVFSRQRYWGEPIPIIHCEKCGAVGVLEKDLPVRLPKVEKYEPTGTGEGPLAGIKEWVNTTCPKCGGPGKRETNTMPQWAGSSWYYLAYVMKEKDSNFSALGGSASGGQFSKYKEEFEKWLPISLYVGGAEHATRHLLYARFWHKFLYDIGAVSTKEPFKKLMHVGLINGEDGRKMSKRWENVINPDEIIKEFGADSIRLYEMFMGPFTQNIAWSTQGVKGVRRFLEKVYNLSSKLKTQSSKPQFKAQSLDRLLHKTIKKVTEDIENFRFNTAISSLMILVNDFEKEENIPVASYELLVTLLAPFAPHIAEEIWHEQLGYKESIFLEKWPVYNSTLLKDEKITLIIQINGKVREQIEVESGVKEEEAKKLALEQDKIVKYIGDNPIKKIIFVKDKLINFVI